MNANAIYTFTALTINETNINAAVDNAPALVDFIEEVATHTEITVELDFDAFGEGIYYVRPVFQADDCIYIYEAEVAEVYNVDTFDAPAAIVGLFEQLGYKAA